MAANFHTFCCCCCCSWVLRHSLTSQAICVTFYILREKSEKFCSEALISAWGSCTYRKSTIRDQQLYFPSEGSHTQDFYALKKFINPAGFEPANLGSSGEYDNHGATGVDQASWESRTPGFHVPPEIETHWCQDRWTTIHILPKVSFKWTHNKILWHEYKYQVESSVICREPFQEFGMA